MDRLPSREGGTGEMMPPRFANLNPAMAEYVSSNDVPVGDKLQRQLYSNIPSSLSHQRQFAGPASEYGATPDSTYGSNSVRGKPSSGRHSLYNGSNASTMSTVARLEGAVGGIQLDTRSEASLPRSEYLIPAAGYGQMMPFGDYWDSAFTALDSTDVFSMPDVNDSQSVDGGTDNIIESHSYSNQNGLNCTICPKERAKVTKTRSEMLKHLRTHLKPFKCHVADCKMAQTGFANETDRKRHYTSCHKDIRTLTEFYKCHHGLCKGKDKPWPRWDNFKKHIYDVHGIRETERERYRVRNTAPLESDLAGIGPPSEPDIGPSPALDTDSGTIDLMEGFLELHQLMGRPVPDAIFSGTSVGPLSQMGRSFPGANRIMPSNIRSSRQTASTAAFEAPFARSLSVAPSTLPSSQISSSVPVLGQHRRSAFPSARQSSSQLGILPSQRRLARVSNQLTPVSHSQKDRDALHGTNGLPKFLRPGAHESVLHKRDVHRGYTDPSQSLHVGFETSPLFRLADDPWTAWSSLEERGSTSKGTPASVDNNGKEDSGRSSRLGGSVSGATPIDSANDSYGGHGDDTADSVDAVSLHEKDHEQRPTQNSGTLQEKLQESKDLEKSAEPQEPQEPQSMHEPENFRHTLRGIRDSIEDKQAHAGSFFDLTGPDEHSDHNSVDGSAAPEVKETPTPSDAVVLDDFALDKLSDDRLQSVLRRLKTDGTLERLGFRLSEIEAPVAPAKRSVRSVRSDQTATKETATKETDQYRCAHYGCSASFVTKSSLRKHEKRHERPFACTFSCTMKGSDPKAFGSKNDWKRHEEGLHFQKPIFGEEWQCGETVNRMDQKGQKPHCHIVFKSAPEYQQHLISQHGHDEADKKWLRETTARYRALPADKCRYWCGFCKKNVPVADRSQSAVPKTYGNDSDLEEDVIETLAAVRGDLHESAGTVKEPATKHKLARDGYILFSEFLSQRFNHIDNHFVGRGERKMNIAQWIHDDTPRPVSGILDSSTVEPANGHAGHDDDSTQRKRHHGDDQPPGSKRSKSSARKLKTAVCWLCCRCGNCHSTANTESCVHCGHYRCLYCKLE